MVIFIAIMSIVGGLVSAAFAWSYGWLAILLSVPIGGSLTALLCAGILFVLDWRSGRARDAGDLSYRQNEVGGKAAIGWFFLDSTRI
jgi:hypothetical protein